MEYGILDFLTLLGSLGFFLYGMKLMSEALQKVAGNKMRDILARMTSTPIKGVFTGLMITAIIQSSSATTVMMVSFVNAGLLSLTESIGVIMGANIGTTVTAWLISILGFKVKISDDLKQKIEELTQKSLELLNQGKLDLSFKIQAEIVTLLEDFFK